MSTSTPIAPLDFGRPRVSIADLDDRTPIVVGWSLGGLTAADRGRLAAFVKADGRRGILHGAPAFGPELER